MGGSVRPSGYVGWGSSGATNVVEPTDAKKQVGWGVNEQPPSSYFNWIQQKQDQWIQYLGWIGTLSPVVDQDFLVTDTLLVQGASFLPLPWYFAANNGFQSIGWDPVSVGIAQPDAAMGTPYIAHQGSGIGELRVEVGLLGARDFQMEHLVTLGPNYNFRPSGAYYEMGLIFNHSGASGMNTQLGWQVTGITGQLFARWVPTGSAPTLLSLGAISATGDTGLHKYTIESRGPTMAFYVDGALRGAVPATVVGASGFRLHFGARHGGASQVSYMVVDTARLRVAR